MVLSGVRSLMFLALSRVKQQVVGWASSVFASACIALLFLACPYFLYVFINAT